MSIFGTIVSKIFGADHPAAAQPGAGAPQGGASTAASATSSPSSGANTATPAAAAPTVDVTSMLDGLETKSGQKLDWRHSIVDLLKLLDMDSSLSARHQLADELHYAGDKADSAAMNIWLHKEVMKKIAENGGKFSS